MTETFYTAKKCPNCNELFNVSGIKQKTIDCPAGCGALLQITPVRIEYVIQLV
jgi:ssDNA-binding Zn-finger/Zn-ribbon topoisomerase 1